MGQRKKPKEPEEEFILYLKEHGASEHTVDSCLAALRLFFRLYGEISAENLDAFRRYLMEHYKISTVNSRIYGINRFLAYCSECKNSYETSGKWALPEKNFRLGVIRSQNPPFLDNIISEKDYEKLRDNLKKDRDMKWYFAVRFLACTGARVSELIQIKREHIQLGYMDLYTKGGKVRRIYFPDYLCSEASATEKAEPFLPAGSTASLSSVPDSMVFRRKRYIHTPSATGSLKISWPAAMILLCLRI